LKIPSFEVLARLDGGEQTLQFNAITNLATGETVGDTALFRAEAEWIDTHPEFDAEIVSIEIRSTVFENVEFHFPKGNDPVHQH